MARSRFLLALLICPAFASAQSFTAVPDTYPYSVSADGSTVFGRIRTGGGDHYEAFRWTRSSGVQRFGRLPGDVRSDPVAASADGAVVVGDSWHWEPLKGDPDGRDVYRGFHWSAASGLTDLGLVPGSFASTVRAVSADGSVVFGQSRFPTHEGSFRWTAAGGIVPLGDPGARTQVVGASADGSVALVQSGGEALLWTAAGGLAPLPAAFEGRAISADGSTVVGYSASGPERHMSRWSADTGTFDTLSEAGEPGLVSGDGDVVAGYVHGDRIRAFRWTEEAGFRILDPPAGMDAESVYTPDAMSADGTVLAGYAADGFSGDISYVWTEGGGATRLKPLLARHGIDTTGWVFMGLTGLSADGRTFVGRAFRTDGGGADYSVIVTIPEPSVLPFVVAITATLLGRRAPRKLTDRARREACFGV
jgi:uncharacterized membrane protein